VFSSNVQSVGWDEATGDLIVTWNTGRVSAYSGVPEDLALQLSTAPSVGGMLNSDIKNQYPHRYLR
jgi:hypothetical protein